MMRIRAAGLALLVSMAGCADGPLPPATITVGVDCSHCRMAVSDPTLAAQLVAPGEDPRFFDDIGCLVAYLKEHPAGTGARAYVADHASGSWIVANDALYSRGDRVATPMGSHLIAHADEAAQARDGSARDAARLTARDVFGPAGAPTGTTR